MHISEAQRRVDEWIKIYGVRYFTPLNNLAILTEEVGEVARLMVRLFGEQSFKNDEEKKQAPGKLKEEMTDVLFVLLCLANQCDIDLEQGLEENILKKTQRDKNRHHQNKKLKS